MKQLRGPKHENWPACYPRAAPPEEYGLKSGENGHLARANGAIDGPYCSPTWPGVCLESGVSRWLVGVVGLGVELSWWSCTSAHRRRVGRFFDSSALVKRAVSRPSATVAEGLAGMAALAPLFPVRPGGTKPLLFTTGKPSQNVQEENRSCARDQVVVARPPVLTPPMALSALSCE
jgi:hypothetical protein